MKIFYSYGEYINNNPFTDIPEFTGKCFWEDISIPDLIERTWRNRNSLFYSHIYDYKMNLIGIFEYDVDYGTNKINSLKFKLPDDKYYLTTFDELGNVVVLKYDAQGRELITTKKEV